jgi:signal transduction histidine kinase
MTTQDSPYVLIIDDERTIRFLLRDYLEDSGFRVYEAENGEKGLTVFRESPDPIQVVLLDLRMPGIDGLEVLKTMRHEAPNVPVIVVSGAGAMKDVIEALRLGAWDYIVKPIENMAMLEHAIATCLERADLLRQNIVYQEHLEELVQQRTQELERSEARYRALNEELELRVRQRTTELEMANTALKDFAYVVSHDLKAPLRGIRRIAGWLCEDYADAFDEHGLEMLDLLAKRVKRMDALIDGVLTYSRIGRIENESERIEMTSVLRDTVDSLAPPDHIRVEISPSLPYIQGDKIRVVQVFQNLIDNAIVFMDKLQGIVRIECHDDSDADGYVTFCVSDNGPGIDPKHHQRIFQIFQTLTTHDDSERTGLGLTVVKKIVELHGGRVWLTSQPGQGSRFYVTFPKSPSP